MLIGIYNVLHHSIWLNYSWWIIITCITYLAVAQLLLRKRQYTAVNWMIICFFLAVASSTLLVWGLNAPMGILTICFVLTLPGILMNARSIPLVTLIVVVILSTIQILHSTGITHPNTSALSMPSTGWDMATYITVFSIFSLVGWTSGSQREKNLQRALQAEKIIKAQKAELATKLEEQSAALRQSQLRQIRELHRFAFIGQSAAATLHELSNQLSIMNLDIEDIGQAHTNSEAIANAKIGMEHMNQIVRQARQELNTYDQVEKFNAITAIRQSIKDSLPKFEHRRVKFTKVPLVGRQTFTVQGSPLALVHCLTILFNNAIDACYNTTHPEVIVKLQNHKKSLVITVSDNGSGIPDTELATLFKPKVSQKPTGLGVGLYITHHIIVNQFNGTIRHEPTEIGTKFIITLSK